MRIFRWRRKPAEPLGPYPGRPDPTPKGDRWVRIKHGVNITDRVSPEYARWVVSKIEEAAPFDTFQVVDSHGEDVTEEYR